MIEPLRIACAQLNPLVGDVKGNMAMLEDAVKRARRQRARLIVFPELFITGYPPEDLLLRDDFMSLAEAQLERLATVSEDMALIVGLPLRGDEGLLNCACFFDAGKLRARYAKRILPNYAVFDEQRYFVAGSAPCVADLDGVRLGIIVCEDVWQAEPIKETGRAGAEVIVNINASPFYIDKHDLRIETLKRRVAETELPIIYVNQVGGQDELVFDGASCLINSDGEVSFTAPAFVEGVYHCRFHDQRLLCDEPQSAETSLIEIVWNALVTGIRDYIGKNNMPGVILGLSGGIDSAVTLALAADALGAERVKAVMLPSAYTSGTSVAAARGLAHKLGVALDEISINPVFSSALKQLAPVFADTASNLTEQNIQARIRGLLLMAMANQYGYGLLATGNKSEMAVGYATLYGDMAGAFAPLKDVVKRRVYELARWCNREDELIPKIILERAPTAELAPNQTDQDTLPPYEDLDTIIEAFVEEDAATADLIARGFSEDVVQKVQSMILNSEFKRRQSPPGVKITSRAFGKDRRYPISSGFKT